MCMSQLYAPTLREDPQEAELASHKLLLRAGFIRKMASGLYAYLPLAWRSLRKIEQIVREEMDATGAQEMMTPILTSAEFWHQSGRWDDYGPELMRISDRHDREFCLGPTHEETFVDLVRNELRSYKQLPCTLYQIQDKFRDEMRPRFGLLRGREFIMKDAYSFHADRESLQKTYDDMYRAYGKICERCRIEYRPVEADSGQIGGKVSTEFMALADAGEAELVYCDCGYAADVEAAEAKPVLTICNAASCEKVLTPGCGTIEDVANFLHVPQNETVKAFAVTAGDGQGFVLFVPGDHEVNEVALDHLFGNWHLMTEEELEANDLVKGYIGPKDISSKVKVIADTSLQAQHKWICGANEPGYHLVGAEAGADFDIPRYGAIAAAQAGDLCPECGLPLKAARGIEVSQVFQLGTKYSDAMGATFMAEDGSEQPFIMGCYGVGVSRMLAAIVEQYNDENGICWPVAIAPYEVAVIPLSVGDDLLDPLARKIAYELHDAGIEVVLDDRDERPGVKFADMDLMGFPYQIVIGKKSAAQGQVEVKTRATGEREIVPASEVVALLAEKIIAQRA
ncbi:MAG: proline--tRNA ligase [Coriobacteriales bacterium]|nr:proline--tRNA ligase [Coriobacteriales bacterium]